MAITSDYNSQGSFQADYPATKVFSITPSDANYLADANDQPLPARAFMVNVAGNIVIIPVGQTSAVTLAVNAGVIYPIQIKKVNSTNTTATGIFGLR